MRMKAFKTKQDEHKNKPHQNLVNSEQFQMLEQDYMQAKQQLQ